MVSKNCISIASIRGMFRDEYRLKYGRIIGSIFSFLHIRALSRIKGIIVMSRAMEEFLQNEGFDKTKIHYIANFVDLSTIPENFRKERIVRGLQPNDVVGICYIGSFNRIKRVDWIIRAIDDLSRRNSNVRITLHLVGTGPLLGKMKKLVRDLNLDGFVKFYGHVNNVLGIIECMDLIVLASMFEGTPRVLMEAMAMGKTCIGPEIGGVSELIQDSINGYLFQPDSYFDLVDKLDHVITKNAFLEPGPIRRWIEQNFDAKKGADRTLQLYGKLLNTGYYQADNEV